jgi:hypothetical protein
VSPVPVCFAVVKPYSAMCLSVRAVRDRRSGPPRVRRSRKRYNLTDGEPRFLRSVRIKPGRSAVRCVLGDPCTFYVMDGRHAIGFTACAPGQPSVLAPRVDAC